MHSLWLGQSKLDLLANWSLTATPGLQDLCYDLPFGWEDKAQTCIRVRGNTGNVCSARDCTLNYFYVVVNKFSHLSVVNYRITKINGFQEEGWRNRGKASVMQASE
jgi:hypothetical protein